MNITNEVLEGYLNCKTKGHLKLAGESAHVDYEAMTSAAKAASENGNRQPWSPASVEKTPAVDCSHRATLKQRKVLLADALARG